MAPSHTTPPSEVSQALKRCTSSLVAVALFRGTIDILTLTGSVFMLQVSDRVMLFQSVPTLVGHCHDVLVQNGLKLSTLLGVTPRPNSRREEFSSCS